MREMTIGRFVRRVLLPLAGVVTLAAATWLLPTGEAQEKGKESAKPEWQKTVEESKTERVSGRRNGVLLRAEADVRKDAKGGVVLIHWSIDYNGPRRPLTIFKPSLDVLAYGQCSVNFFSIDKDAEAPDVGIHPDTAGHEPTLLALALAHPDKSRFITIQKKEVATGTIEVPLSLVATQTQKLHPGKFRTFPPNQMFAQFDFRPSTRAESLNLDPWTGILRTAWISVPIEKLARD